jgi:phage tail tape-measure protein
MPSYSLDITVQGHDRASGVFKPVESAISRILTIAGGIVASKIILGVADQIGYIAARSLEATAQLQLMQVSLESLAARELVRASEGMLTLTDVEGKAGNMAKKMIDELSRISILSPYTVEAVQNTFRLNTAFGYTFDQAKKMTEGLLQMASGIGADNEQLNRMAYNLAQVRLQGSVTALDVRQLALAGVDLQDVLKRVSAQYGYQIENHKEFNDLVKEGKISWEQFSEGFARYANEYFGKSSEKMARTLLGLKSTFNDVFILTMPKIIGPSVEKVTGVLGKLLDMFLKVRETSLLEDLGKSWSSTVGGVLDPISRMMDRLNEYVTLWLKVKDITASAVDVRDAREQLMSLEAPLDIIKDTLTEVFGEKIGKLLGKGVDKIVDGVGKIKTAFKELSEGRFEEAFKTLGVPQGLIDFVNDVMAAVTNLKEFWAENGSAIKDVLRELAEGLLEFAGIQVEDALEGTGGFFESLTQKLVDNGPKIVETLSGVKDTILNEVLPGIDRFIDKLTNEWIPKAIDFAEYLKNNWQPILQKVLMILLAIAAAGAVFSILKGVAGIILMIAGAIGHFLIAVGLAGGITAFFTTLASVASAMLPIVLGLLAALAVAFIGVVAALGGFILAAVLIWKNWSKLQDVFQVVKDVLKNALGPAFKDLLGTMEPLKQAGKDLAVAFQPIWQVVAPILSAVLKGLALVLGVILVNAFALFVGALTGGIRFITGMVNTLVGVIQGIVMAIQGIMNVVVGLFQAVFAAVTGNTEALSAAGQRILLGLKQILGGIAQTIVATVVGLVGTLMSTFFGFAQGVSSVWASIWTAIASRATGGMANIANIMATKWNQILNVARSMASEFSTIGSNIVNAIRTGINNGWGGLISWIQNRIQALINAARNALNITSPSKVFLHMGEMITEGLKQGIGSLPNVLDSLIVNPLQRLPERASPTMYDNHATSYYAPVYQIVQQSPDRISVVNTG